MKFSSSVCEICGKKKRSGQHVVCSRIKQATLAQVSTKRKAPSVLRKGGPEDLVRLVKLLERNEKL